MQFLTKTKPEKAKLPPLPLLLPQVRIHDAGNPSLASEKPWDRLGLIFEKYHIL